MFGVDFVLNVTLLYVFLNKLHAMIQELDESFEQLLDDLNQVTQAGNVDCNDMNANYKKLTSESNESDLETIGTEIDRNKIEQKEIVNWMAKYVVLTIVSQLFQQIWYLVMIARYFGFINNNLSDGTLILLDYICGCLSLTVNCVVMYFTFIFNEKQYYKCCCCRNCHKCIQLICIHCIKKNNIERRTKKEVN